jgi:hypothetical protein
VTDETDPWIEAITPERIARALAGYPLPLAHGWDMTRLTRAVQAIANLGRDKLHLGPTRQSDRDAKKELEKLARQALAVGDGIEALGDGAFYAVIMGAAIVNQGESGHLGYRSDDYPREFVEPLRKIAKILSLAAENVGARPRQKPRWTEKEAKAMRVRFALVLAGVFADAFDQEPKADNWHADLDDRPQPWPDFYRRIYGELFGKTEGLNLQEVLQEAARIRAGKAKIPAIGSYSFLFPPRVAS